MNNHFYFSKKTSHTPELHTHTLLAQLKAEDIAGAYHLCDIWKQLLPETRGVFSEHVRYGGTIGAEISMRPVPPLLTEPQRPRKTREGP